MRHDEAHCLATRWAFALRKARAVMPFRRLPLSFIRRPAIFQCTFLLTQDSLSGMLFYSAEQNRAQMPIVSAAICRQ